MPTLLRDSEADKYMNVLSYNDRECARLYIRSIMNGAAEQWRAGQ
jgi:hypothetical protein